MKRLFYLAVAIVIAGFALQSCTNDKHTEKNGNSENGSKILVCYFSATGTTERAAQRIADLTGGTLHNIARKWCTLIPTLIGVTHSRAPMWRCTTVISARL